jgi:hypothetical protein
MGAMKQDGKTQYIIPQEQDAGCSLSVCRPAGLRYRPILVGAFCRRSTGFRRLCTLALLRSDRAMPDWASALDQRGRQKRRSLQQRRLPVNPVAECAVQWSGHAYATLLVPSASFEWRCRFVVLVANVLGIHEFNSVLESRD